MSELTFKQGSRIAGWRWLRVNLGFVVLGLAVAALAWPIITTSKLPWVQTDRIAINDLKRLQVGDPVELEGVVTFVDSQTRSFYLQDDVSGTRIALDAELPQPGERVRLRAQIGHEYDERVGLRSVQLANVRILDARRVSLPIPQSIAIADLLRNGHRREGRRIRISGVVRAARVSEERLTLELGDAGQRMAVTVLQSDGLDTESLIDARIEVSGALELGLDRRAETFAPHLWVVSPKDLVVRTPRAASAPLLPSVRALFTESAWIEEGHRVRVRASVVRVDSPDRLLVADGALLLPVETDRAEQFRPGEAIEASGWPTRQRWNVVLARASVSRLASRPASRAEHVGPVLTRIEQIRSLDGAEASKNHLVRIEGVLTSVHHAYEFLFVQTGETGIFVDAWGQSLSDLKPGLRVQIAGVTGAGEFAPVIAQPWVKVLGSAPLPIPQHVDPDVAPGGAYDSKWVEIDGAVRPFVAAVGTYEFNLETAIGPVGAILIEYGDPARLDALVDARVRLRGVFATSFTSKGVLTGYRMFVQSLEHVELLHPAKTGADADPPRPIGELLRFTAHVDASRRIRVRGAVTMRVPGQLYVEDDSGSLQVRGVDADVRVGDVVEIIGYPSPSDQGPIMVDASVRALGSRAELKSLKTEALRVLNGKLDNRLVSIEARLVSQGESATQQTLVLQSGYTVFNAELAGSVPLPALREGSIVQVTGICAVQHQQRADFRSGYNTVPDSFRIILRSVEDVQVMHVAPWWNLRHAWPAFALLTLSICLAMLWARSLRRRVAAQTAQIEHQRSFLRQVIDMCPDRISVKDRAGRYTLANRALADEYGEPPENLLGRTDIDCGLDEMQARAAQQEDADVLEHRCEKEIAGHSRTDRSGRVLWFHTVKRPILDAAGTPTHVLGMSNEITAHKEAEETLRTARMAAEAANRAKSEFLANMSHEIRTPLNGIIGMSELCLDTELSSEQREYVQALKLSGDGLLGVINDILDFSKIEAGKLELESRPLDVRGTLEGVLKTLALQAHRSNVELLCEVAPNVPVEVLGDVNRLRQVLLNLIGDAIKSTEQGEVLVEVSLSSQDDTRCSLQFTLHHGAAGAALQDSDRFDMLGQQEATRQSSSGAELGVTISNRLIALMHGHISVDRATNGEGRMYFTVQLGVIANQRPFQLQIGKWTLRDVRILVVDDNASCRGILERTLSRWGMRPIGASSASEGFERLQECMRSGDPCSIALVDLGMPVRDGLSLVEQIREIKAPVAVIAMSNSGPRHWNATHCRALSIDGHVSKPVRLFELHGAVVQALEERDPGGRVAAPHEGGNAIARDCSLSILVAEDNAVNQMVMQRLLHKRQHRVTIAGSGTAALRAYENAGFDLILMDVQMPELDGLQATREIRRREAGGPRHTPIVALTAHAMSGDRERCLDAGMDGYMTKPVSPRELDEVLARVDGGQRTADGENGDWRTADGGR